MSHLMYQQATRVEPPRVTEARALLNTARGISDAVEKEQPNELLAAIRRNRQLWVMFGTSMMEPDCQLPAQIRLNICQLADFVSSRTLELEVKPEAQRCQILININKEIAAGLLQNA
ncbi:MAG: flagellar protein FlaF [Rhodospirillaceae bacterium]|jgi:Flagellar biosynthesis regulator FlaF|nr:flagellar protein FlaF [Rhodospirillaceae bacterium]